MFKFLPTRHVFHMQFFYYQVKANKMQGDLVTPCQYAWESNVTYGEPWTCNYTLDVTQGW